MALNWDLTNIADYERLCYRETGETNEEGKPLFALKTTTDALIWASMAVGLGGITEKNWRDWFARLSVCEHNSGAWRHDGKGEAVYFTPEEVRAHIGLRVNVSRETDAQWRKRHVTRWLEAAKARAERAETEAA